MIECKRKEWGIIKEWEEETITLEDEGEGEGGPCMLPTVVLLLRLLLQDQSILLHNSLEMEETICGEG